MDQALVRWTTTQDAHVAPRISTVGRVEVGLVSTLASGRSSAQQRRNVSRARRTNQHSICLDWSPRFRIVPPGLCMFESSRPAIITTTIRVPTLFEAYLDDALATGHHDALIVIVGDRK